MTRKWENVISRWSKYPSDKKKKTQTKCWKSRIKRRRRMAPMNRGRICLNGERENVLFLKSSLRLHGPCHHSWEDCQQTEKAGLCLYHLEGTQSCPVLQAKQDQGQLGLGWTICLRSLVWTWLLVLPASPQQRWEQDGRGPRVWRRFSPSQHTPAFSSKISFF